MKDVLRLDDFEPLAREKLDAAAYAYYVGGAGDEITLQENAAAFKRYRLKQRVLVDVSTVDTSTTFLGSEASLPVGLAPNAMHTLADPEGEVATALAAAAAKVLMCLSTLSGRSMEDVAAAAPAHRWFQLYVPRDRALAKDLIQRAVDAGYEAIVLTADLPVPGYRERELRDPVTFGDPSAFGNFFGFVDTQGADLLEMLDELINPAITWEDIEWIKGASDLPFVLKGVMCEEDARLAIDHGVDGLVVSNHGGRQLDRVPATIDVLEEITASVGDKGEVFLDGGVRRGVDVVTALALGARGAFIGRPYLFAQAAGGEAGVTHAIDLMRAEVANAMALVGARSIAEVTRDCLFSR
ncbi:MAG: alpha-hydroxy acid oxidase [Actinomycetota bacterium]